MRVGLALWGLLCVVSSIYADPKAIADFQPDPATVQRYGPAWRYPQAGWIVLHIEGKPYERGVQHGRLLASEIAAYVRCFAAEQSSKSPTEAWKETRTLVNALFLRRFDKEFLEEMQGIADGASAVGAKFDGRAIDLVDIVAVNVWAEIESLDSALELSPNGLEGLGLPKLHRKAAPSASKDHCTAFAATGPATADGKIVFGHITMSGLYSSRFYNVWLDVQPSKGHRIVMQSYPGGIQSGMDYYLNDAGLIVCETTIEQTKFDPRGTPLTSRIRKAMQYSDSIDQVVKTLEEGNNGLYANEWLLADLKTNEIAMFELGTEKSKLWRSSKNEWFADTDGFYWGCNNAKDMQVRLETIRDVNDRPTNMVWKPSDRDKTWMKFYRRHKGKLSAELGQVAFTTPPLCAGSSGDAKITTTALAKELKSLALFGPPLGKPWLPTDTEKHDYPEVVPLVANPWTLLEMKSPPPATNDLHIVDLPEKVQSWSSIEDRLPAETEASATPAWHGTILPKTDEDVWLAAGFAEYEKIVAAEHAFLEENGDDALTLSNRRYLRLLLYAHRCEAVQSFGLKKSAPNDLVERAAWIRGETGKGVMRLGLLRDVVGKKIFDETMDSFGKAHAGKTATVAEFKKHFEKATKQDINSRWLLWDSPKDTPDLAVKKVQPRIGLASESELALTLLPIEGILTGSGTDPSVSLSYPLEVTLDAHSSDSETTRMITPGKTGEFSVPDSLAATALTIGKYQPALWGSRPDVHVMTFHHDLDECLIVYGTTNDEAANRETAAQLQETIRKHGSNITVPIVADRDVKPAQLRGRHLLLIGAPAANELAKQYEKAFSLAFRGGSFTVDGETYANAGSAVIAAASHPGDARYSIVMFAGLSGEATYHAPTFLLQKGFHPGQFLVIPGGSKAKSIVLPPSRLKVDVSRISFEKK